jgi:hypothetical protein
VPVLTALLTRFSIPWWPWFDSKSVHKAECIRAYPLSDEEITALAHYLTHLSRMLSKSVRRSFEKIMRKA